MSLAIREIQIKMHLRFHFIHLRMAKIKNTNDSSRWRKCGARKTLLHCWWECNLYSHFGNQYDGFSENWESIYCKTQSYHSWASTRRMLHLPQGPLLNSVHRSFAIARSRQQPRCFSTKEWVNKMWYLYTMEYYSTVKIMAL